MVMNKFDRLHDAINSKKTILCVGPISKYCIDSVIELANENQIPMVLIASRRQVECRKLGEGYVFGTESFVNYVRKRDTGGWVYLARDHGGPWQGNKEEKIDYSKAMQNALISYENDIKYGIDIIHIDPSLKSRPINEIISDVNVLYSYCEAYAKSYGKEIIYEAGTEEHGGHITEPSDFENFVKNIKDVSPKIKFVVGNVGLYVKERKNTGMLNQTRAEKLVKICNQNNLYLKCHNVDYVNSHQNNGIVWRLNQLGVHAINIAPEIGVQETETLLYTWRSHGYFEEAEKFIELAYKSGKWFKWMTNKGDVKSKEERAIIAGHYIFNYWAVEEMRKYINKKEGGNIEERVKFMIMSNIRDYLMNLNWEVK